jgi:hypothetical protein
MLEDQASGALRPQPQASRSDLDEMPARHPGVLPAPDPGVADSARLRLATLCALSTGQLPEEAPARPVDDIQAVRAVINASRQLMGYADALDVGAALVVLCDQRARLDRLEADLLGTAQQVGLTWDVIAAIIGIPAAEAEFRHHALRASLADRPPD